ncbi:hypothetical protein AAVH_20424 [Aphelenchoides avenae]|nr:hypothetical protein AAVH_20424 [Aphelenchus avenae]
MDVTTSSQGNSDVMEMVDCSKNEAVQPNYGVYRETSPGHINSEETLLAEIDDEQNQKPATSSTPVPEVERYTSSRFSKISLEDIPGYFANQSEPRTASSSDDSGVWTGENGSMSPDPTGIHSNTLYDAAKPQQLDVNDGQKQILTGRVSSSEDERAQLDEERRSLEESRARFEQEVLEFERFRAEHSRRVADEANTLRSEEDRIKAKEQHLAQEQTRLSDEKRNVDEERQGLLEDMKELQRRLDAKADLERRERDVFEREQQLQTYKATDSSLVEQVAEANLRLDQATEKNGHLEQELTELKRVMNDMKEHAAEQEKIIGELTGQNEALKAAKGPSSHSLPVQQSLSRQKSKIKTLEQTVKNERQRSGKVERELDVANSRLEKLQDKIDDLELAKEVLEADVASLKREVTTWQGTCDALTRQLQTTEEKLQTWKSAYLIADGDRKELKVEHDKLIEDLKNLSQRLVHETKEKIRLREALQTNNNTATSSNATAFHAGGDDVILIDVDMSQPMTTLNGTPPTAVTLPHFFRGKVVPGHGRGGRKLNCPTANLDESAILLLPADFVNGVYAGFARVRGGHLYQMVMSVGNNPQFNAQQRTMEVHVLHEFDGDFYGELLEGVAVAYLRPMKSFGSLEELVKAIDDDKTSARTLMDANRRNEVENHSFFTRA